MKDLPKWKVKTLKFIANKLPKSLVYFVIIRGWNVATTGKYSNTVINQLNITDLVNRVEEWAKIVKE